MSDKYIELREAIKGNFISPKQVVPADTIRALLAERDALLEALESISDWDWRGLQQMPDHVDWAEALQDIENAEQLHRNSRLLGLEAVKRQEVGSE